MLLTVSKSSKTPVFEQIFNQITNLVNRDTLAAGSELPPTRELAKTLGVNRSTIIRYCPGKRGEDRGRHEKAGEGHQVTGIVVYEDIQPVA